MCVLKLGSISIKTLRMKWLAFSSFSLINPESFTVPFVGGRDQGAGGTLIKKRNPDSGGKKRAWPPFGQTSLSPP